MAGSHKGQGNGCFSFHPFVSFPFLLLWRSGGDRVEGRLRSGGDRVEGRLRSEGNRVEAFHPISPDLRLHLWHVG